MSFKLTFTALANAQLDELEADAGQSVQLRAVRRALGHLERDPNHPSLNVHPWKGEDCVHGKTLFEAYAQNKTPGAYRIFFCYVPGERGTILVAAITPHP